MPVKSYLLQTVRGQQNELISALQVIPACELIRTENPDLFVLLTDTPSRREEKELERDLEALPGIGCLSLVSAYDDQEF